MLPKTIPILVSSTVKMELPSELTGQDRLAFFLLLLEKGRTWKRKGIIFCKYGNSFMETLIFGMIVVISNREVGVAMSDLNQTVEFIKEIEKLKSVTRFNRTLDGRFENSAEHSWQGAIAAMVLQDYYPEKLNMEKVISMLLIHDLGEIYAGDTWVFDDEKKLHSHDRELASIEKTMSILPEEKYLQMKNSWLEFEKGQSAEARYARVIDALVPLINHLEVSELHYNPDNISADMVLEKKKFIKSESKELWKLTEDLIQESVEKGLYS